MNTKTITLLAALLLSTTCFARLGETKDQAAARYGKPVKCEPESGAECCTYNAARFTIKCYFIDGIVGALLVSTPDKTPFSEDEITVLQNANSGGSAWIKQLGQPQGVWQWDRADGKAWMTIARGDAMLIESAEWRAHKKGMDKF